MAYVADSGATGVQKYTFNGTTWTLDYNFTAAGNGLTDLSVDFSGAQPVLYAVSPTALFSVTDAGAAGAFASIATAGTNFAFRGVEFIAVPEPTTYALIGMTVLGAGLWYRRRNKVGNARFARA